MAYQKDPKLLGEKFSGVEGTTQYRTLAIPMIMLNVVMEFWDL
eukprot:UN08230